MTQTFRGTLYKVLPRWLLGPTTSRVLYTVALHLDFLAEGATDGLLCGFPGAYSEGHTLWRTGAERGLRQYAGEPDTSFAARLIDWLWTLRTAGTAPTLLDQMQLAWSTWEDGVLASRARCDFITNDGSTFVLESDGILTHTYDTPWVWDAHSTFGAAPLWRDGLGRTWGADDGRRWGGLHVTDTPYVSRFWIVVWPTAGQLTQWSTANWGGRFRWRDGVGRKWGFNDGLRWGGGGGGVSLGRWGDAANAQRPWGGWGTRTQIEATKQVVREYTAPHACCWEVIIVLDDEAWEDGLPYGDWTHHAARNPHALYWAGQRPQ